MSLASQRAYARIIAVLTIVAIPIALVIFAFSSCDVRKRSEKRACKAGKVEQCVAVATYYDDKQGGIISFLMSYADTALAYYFEACKLQSSSSCDRMMYVFHNGEQAKNLSTDLGQMADALIEACIGRVDKACDNLASYMTEADWVANRSAFTFKQRCDHGNANACFRLGAMHGKNLGGLRNNLEEVLPLYDKACAGHVATSCELAKAYRDEQSKRQPR